MRNNIAVGIDIGTYQVKVVITESTPTKSGLPKIIGVGYAESKGLRHGYIINQADAVRSIRKAVRQAEKTSGVKVERAYISIGGIGLSSHTASGRIMISRADSEVTDLDIEKISEEVKKSIPTNISINRQTIHAIPIEYKIDNNQVWGDPVSLKGHELEAKILYITCLSHHINELISAVENAGIEIADAVASPIAAGIVNLSKTERVAGCVMVNIGSETVSMVVYEEDVPISLEVFKVGSNDITNDIALGLQVSLEEAEKIKQETRIDPDASKSSTHKKTPEGKLESIITARLSDVFKLVEEHLKKINRNGLLPAGIILTGGGSGITSAEDLAKATLNLPSRVAQIANNKTDNGNNVRVKDSTWSVAYGLCVYGLSIDSDEASSFRKGGKFFKHFFKNILSFIKRLLP